MIVFKVNPPNSATVDLLILVPEANATYRYQIADHIVTQALREEGIRTWPFLGVKTSPDEYLKTQIIRFADFVSHAQREDRSLDVEVNSTALFKVDPNLKAERFAQIEHAAKRLYQKRPLHIEIANFSDFTEQINALIPELHIMTTFTVLHPHSKDETIEVGRETPLKSIQEGLQHKIEANSTALLIE